MSTNSDLDGLDYNISSLEKKIYIIADEVLDILKNLSHENQQQLNTKLIAERMFIKDTVKKMLSETGTASNDQSEFIFMKEIANNVLDRFSQLAPLTMNPALSSIKDRLHDKSYVEDTAAWLDSTIKIVKKYFNDLADRFLIHQKMSIFVPPPENFFGTQNLSGIRLFPCSDRC